MQLEAGSGPLGTDKSTQTDIRNGSGSGSGSGSGKSLREDLAGANHLAGVVLSSGPAVALGATNPTVENQTTLSTAGCGLRRLISPHTVRETVVIPLRDDVTDQHERWTAAYAAEPEWLPQDLSGKGSHNSPPSWVDRRQSRSLGLSGTVRGGDGSEQPVPRPLLGRG